MLDFDYFSAFSKLICRFYVGFVVEMLQWRSYLFDIFYDHLRSMYQLVF